MKTQRRVTPHSEGFEWVEVSKEGEIERHRMLVEELTIFDDKVAKNLGKYTTR